MWRSLRSRFHRTKPDRQRDARQQRWTTQTDRQTDRQTHSQRPTGAPHGGTRSVDRWIHDICLAQALAQHSRSRLTWDLPWPYTARGKWISEWVSECSNLDEDIKLADCWTVNLMMRQLASRPLVFFRHLHAHTHTHTHHHHHHHILCSSTT